MTGTLNEPLASVDADVARAIDHELGRQQATLEMIASENFAPAAVMEAQGSVLTNKYAEGYPGKRYYGGCEHVDVIEQLAIDRVKALFGAEFANVQPHSGAQANAAAMFALLQPGRHHPGPVPGPRRPPHPRHAHQLLRQALQRGPVRGARGGPCWIDMAEVEAPGPGAPPEADRRRLVRLLPAAGLRRVPPDRRPGRRLPDGGHGALRRPGGRRAAPQPGAPTPTSSPPPPTRPSAARAAASS